MNIKDGFGRLVEDAKIRIQEVNVEEASALIAEGTAIVVDVREKDEYQAGHVPGAVHFSRGTIEIKLPEAVPDPAAIIICYCGVGGRSALVADNLQKMGYTSVMSLAGGFQAWTNAGYEVNR